LNPSAETHVPQNNHQPTTHDSLLELQAFVLAAFDQMAKGKGNAPVAGEAFWWAMSGGAGAGLARKAFVRILFLEARAG
jgi:hypothetical protein